MSAAGTKRAMSSSQWPDQNRFPRQNFPILAYNPIIIPGIAIPGRIRSAGDLGLLPLSIMIGVYPKEGKQV